MSYKISKELLKAVRKDINGVVSIDCSKQEIDNHFRVNYKQNFGLFHYDEFFFKCIDFMNENDIQYYLNIEDDIRNEIFEFLENWLKINKRNC